MDITAFLRRAIPLGLCLGVLVGCQPSGATGSPSEAAVPIPTSELSDLDRCMLQAGFHISEVHPGYSGSGTWYSWEAGPDVQNPAQAMVDCRSRYAPYHEKTVDELRVVYDRWVGEYQCLIGLGYRPAEPPSFETFVQTWKTGPWMPIDGINTNSWSGAQYEEAKQKCGLEMFDR